MNRYRFTVEFIAHDEHDALCALRAALDEKILYKSVKEGSLRIRHQSTKEVRDDHQSQVVLTL